MEKKDIAGNGDLESQICDDGGSEEVFESCPSSPQKRPQSPLHLNVVPKILKTKPISLAPASDHKMFSDPNNPVAEDVSKTSHSDTMAVESETKDMDKSPLEATFTHPTDPLEEGKKSRRQKADYRALEFAASSSSHTNSLTISMNGEDKHLTDPACIEEEAVLTALLALFFSLFGPLFTLGMAYWHYIDDQTSAALLTLVVFAIAIFTVHVAYLFSKSSPKKKIWKSSKIVWLLCIIPGCTSPILSFCNCIFALREKQSRTYERSWRHTGYIFLAESLALAFPQALLHLVLLAEDANSIPSYKGYAAAIGAAILSLQITFSRFRYDSQNKYERFGTGVEKYIRFVCMWSNKVLWLVTFTLVILSLRLGFPMQKTWTSLAAIGLMLAVHEIPVLLLMSPALGRAASNLLELMMMIPQFVSLSALIVYVNLHPTVYSFDNGSLLLGLFFWSETVILTGWLYDRCTGREIDFIPLYPHFFGDISTSIRD